MLSLRKMTQLIAFTLNSATTALNPIALFKLFIQHTLKSFTLTTLCDVCVALLQIVSSFFFKRLLSSYSTKRTFCP